MRKLIILFILCTTFLLSGCNIKTESETASDTYIISGTITEKSGFYSTRIVIQTDNNMKMPVYESRYTSFTNGLNVGDKVCFEIEKEGGGYRIIGIGIEND